MGNFTIIAQDPDSCSPATMFSYTGNLSGVGCESGSGTWQNNNGDSGSWNWSKPCDGPNSETTTTNAWDAAQPTAYDWLAYAVSYSGLYFGGRTATENDAGFASDSCYFPGSIIAQFTALPNTSVVVNWSQNYRDAVGWTTDAVSFYRPQRAARGLPMPCNFNAYQNVKMSCSSAAPIQYTTNQLSGVIDVTTVQSWRSGQGQTRTW